VFHRTWMTTPCLLVLLCVVQSAVADDVIPPASVRFRTLDTDEVPDFQKHVSPLLGRLGCNGRACHGSFQGQGGFRLSLFGYDFNQDHKALLAGDPPRVNLDDPEASLILEKPTLLRPHKGGKRMAVDSWEYNLLVRWIEGGAKGVGEKPAELASLEVKPSEILFRRVGEKVQVRVYAHWRDGTVEDVTPLCRFQTNDESVATVSRDGLVTCTGKGDTHIVAFYDSGVTPVPVILPVTDLVGDRYPDVPTPTEIDRLVVQKLRKLGIVPSELCSDAEFLRRVRLDLTGTLPSRAEVEEFLSDTRPDKRRRKIDELLETPDYAAWWATKLCDLTGNNASVMLEPAFRQQMAQQWYRWMYARVRENVPYDKIVEGIVLATGRLPGQSYREYCEEMASYVRAKNPADFAKRPNLPHYWARTNMRQPADRALWVSYSFLGIRLECAQCHKHPFDRWTKADFDGFAAVFAPVTYNISPQSRPDYNALVEELGLKGKRGGELRRAIIQLARRGQTVPVREVYVNRAVFGRARRRAVRVRPKLLGGEVIDLKKYEDPRQAFMEWLRRPDNPYFATAFVNRVWAHYFGRGIIEPSDEISLANPPSNRPLLDYLVRGFIESGYDMKWLHREILNSRTYQLSSTPNATNASDNKNFSKARVRRLPAEVLFDAVRLAAAGPSAEKELRADVMRRAIGMLGGQGVDPRRRAGDTYVLSLFGKPARLTNCDCERSNEPNLLQTLFLWNDASLLQLLRQPNGWAAAWAKEINGEVQRRAQARGAARAAKIKELSRTVEALRKRIARLRQQKRARQAAVLQGRLNLLSKQLARLRKTGGSTVRAASTSTRSDGATRARLAEAVRDAYLRTLSRPPSDAELKRCVDYIVEVGDVKRGLEDVLWALVNTKEFVTNH